MSDPAESVPDRVRLPLTFEVGALLPALGRVAESDWEPHFNTQQYEGDWSGVALRTAIGSPLSLYPDPSCDEFTDTPLLAASPELQAALSQLACPLQTVRLLRLGPGATITSHRDHHLAHRHGEVRLHVPLVSGPDVTFWLDEVEVPMRLGECWYLDLTKMHRVTNSGPASRVHLVIDCRVDEWLTAQLVEGTPGSSAQLDPIA